MKALFVIFTIVVAAHQGSLLASRVKHTVAQAQSQHILQLEQAFTNEK